jgi:hypothetical protein
MKRFISCALVFVVMLFTLYACDSASKEQTTPATTESDAPVSTPTLTPTPTPGSEDIGDDGLSRQNLNDIIPSLTAATNVSVKAPGSVPSSISEDSSAPGIYVQASDNQAERVLNILEPLSSASFTVVEDTISDTNLLSTNIIRVENASESSMFALSAPEDGSGPLYIVVFPNQTPDDILSGEEILPPQLYKAHPGVFPIRDLNDTLQGIILDTGDTPNVAVVRNLDSNDAEYSLNKWITALWRHTIDATLRINGATEDPDERGYNREIIIDGATYFFNTITGYFSKEIDGVITLGKLDDDILTWLLGSSNLG